MNRIFVDLDGVVVDFDGHMRRTGRSAAEVKVEVGAYYDMRPIDGALEAVRSLIGMGFEVWIATKPPTGIAHAYSDKAAWVWKHLPELKRRIIITHDKGLLGDAGDFLCDDRPHKANCEAFTGTLLRFVDGFHWPQALKFFREVRDTRRAALRAAAKTGELVDRLPTATDILERAIGHMNNRAAERDQPGGERSMGRTVTAFNALTGHQLSERDGWVFMGTLKFARACTTPTGRPDDYEDAGAYAGLAGEAAARMVCA
jgi:hypothetical protein